MLADYTTDYTKKVQVKQKVLIKLVSGYGYRGTCVFRDENKITITDVVEIPSDGTVHDSPFHFYKTEICEVIPEVDELTPAEVDAAKAKKEAEKEITIRKQHILEYEEERKALGEVKGKKYIYIQAFGPLFENAIKYLLYSKTIAILGIGCIFGKTSKIKVLAVATRDPVFLFDVKEIGDEAFQQGMKHVLQFNHILKVVHNCREITESLKHKHNISLTNVWDIQVADLMIRRKYNNELPSSMRTLSECIQEYLQYPVEREPNIMQIVRRPIPHDLKLQYALNVSSMRKLKFIMELKMLGDFDSAVKACLDEARNELPWKQALMYPSHIQMPKCIEEMDPRL